MRALGFEGVFQVASFHPQYRFAGIETLGPRQAVSVVTSYDSATNTLFTPIIHRRRNTEHTKCETYVR